MELLSGDRGEGGEGRGSCSGGGWLDNSKKSKAYIFLEALPILSFPCLSPFHFLLVPRHRVILIPNASSHQRLPGLYLIISCSLPLSSPIGSCRYANATPKRRERRHRGGGGKRELPGSLGQHSSTRLSELWANFINSKSLGAGDIKSPGVGKKKIECRKKKFPSLWRPPFNIKRRQERDP